MSKNRVFGFTSGKSHLLPSIFNALQEQRTLLRNFSKLLCKNLEIVQKVFFMSVINFLKKCFAENSFSLLKGVNGTAPNTHKTFFG